MSTGIQWTDETWNPVTGCSKVSPGCANCYAEGAAVRFWGKQYRPRIVDAGKFADWKTLDTVSTSRHDGYLVEGFARPRKFTDVMCHQDRLDQPLRWKRPRRIFVNSMSDLFHEDVPDAFIDRVFAVMALAPQHTFQVLTKRAERMRDYINGEGVVGGINGRSWRIREAGHAIAGGYREGVNYALELSNLWLGVSVENQHFADERIPLLLQTPAAVRFISAEPLLGPVRLDQCAPFVMDGDASNPGVLNAFNGMTHHPLTVMTEPPREGSPDGVSWVIVGGESGPGARPFRLEWGESLIRQCHDAGVPCFMKQFGAQPLLPNGIKFPMPNDPRKGGDPADWPRFFRVRQFPEAHP